MPLVSMIIRKLVIIIRMQLCALVEGRNKSGHKVTDSQSLWMTGQCVFKDQHLHFIVAADSGMLEGRLIMPSGFISFSQVFLGV